MKKFVYAVAFIALSVSSCQDLTVERPNTGNIKVGKVSFVGSKTKASSEVNEINDGSFTVIETIETSETPLTKASETNSGNLSSFYLDGFLDSNIQKTVAYQQNPENLHFMTKAEATKGDDGTWSLSGGHTWRNLYDHYFWAYSDNVTDLAPVAENDFTSVKFGYDASAGNKDLVLAYAVKGDGIDHSDPCIDSDDDYISLCFKHALAEIVFDPSGLEPKVDGTEKTPKTHNLTIKSELTSVTGVSSCEFDSNSFKWAVNEDSNVSLTFETTNSSVNRDSNSFFVIPQNRDHVLFLQITDELTGFSFPHQVELTDVSWSSGYKYTYRLVSNILVPPYIDGADYQGFNFNASGNTTTGKLVGGLPAKYIKTIDLDWTGLPTNDANGVYLVLYFAKEQMKDNEVVTMYGNHTDESHDGLVFGTRRANGAANTSTKKQAVAELKIDANNHVSLTGVELPYDPSDPSAVYSLYAFYSGGSMGGGNQHNASNLVLQNLNVTIADRRY